VDVAIPHFRYVVVYAAPFAFEYVKVGPHFPVDFSPRYSISFSDECDKSFEIPSSIDNMLCPNLSVIINVGLGFLAVQNLTLAHSE
jgi:hypothetical protein